jgi:hypothetical protein
MSYVLVRIRESFSLRSGEAPRLAGLILCSLFLGIFSAFFLSAALSLFLAGFDISVLPYAYIASALVGYAAVTLFSRLGRRLSPPALLSVSLLAVLTLVGLFWAASLRLASLWIPFLMVVAIAPLATLLDLGFWGLASRLFDLRQGKRLFALVSAGEVVSSIVGYFLVPVLLHFLKRPIHLLPVAGGGLVLCLGVAQAIGRRYSASLREPARSATSARRGRLLILFRDRYFLLIAAAMALFVAALYVIDFGFLSEVRREFSASQSAQFFGVFFGLAKVGELLMRVFGSGKLVNQFGIRFGLLALPAVLLACVSLAVFSGPLLGPGVLSFFVLAALTKLVWMVLARSLYDPSYRVLYQPLGERQLAFQTGAEGIVRQAGIFIVGIALAQCALQGVGVESLFTALLPLLAAWAAVIFPLLREYRQRVLRAMPRTRPEETTGSMPVWGMAVRLSRRLSGTTLETALGWLEITDPLSVPGVLMDLLSSSRPEARRVALEHARRALYPTLQRDAQRCMADKDSGVRAAAEAALAAFREIDAAAASPSRTTALARSPQTHDRCVAAHALETQRSDWEQISRLLWDQDRAVRRAALRAAGSIGAVELRQRIAAHLHLPGLTGAATAAVVQLGEEAIPELETAFGRAASPRERIRILRLAQRIGGPRAQQLLLTKLAFPDRTIQAQALLSLAALEFRAAGEQREPVARRIEDMVENAAWNTAALLDLGTDPSLAAVRAALQADLRSAHRILYSSLSLLYDPQAIRLVQENLAGGDREAAVYALEVLDLLVSSDLKPILLPLFEGLAPAQTLRRLEPFAPQSKLAPAERLCAIVQRERGTVSTWTRICALQALGAVSRQVPAELAATLHHSDPLLQEAAAEAVYRISPEEYARYAQHLPPERRLALDRIVGAAGAAGGEARILSGFARALRCQSCPQLSALPRAVLLDMGDLAEEHRLAAGEEHGQGESPSLYLVVEGALEPSGEALLGSRDAPVRALEPSRVLRLESERLCELIGDHNRLLPRLLEIAESAPASGGRAIVRADGQEARAFHPIPGAA